MVVLVLALVGAFFVSRGCQRTAVRITEAQAVAIGQRQLDFNPQGHQIRIVQRGVPPKRFWAVSYFVRNKAGGYSRLTVLLVDANTGKVQIVNERP